MIGLEGSGFTICLGVILLLTGIVMYYCKSKITQNEHKINSMFKLVTALHEEVNQLKATQQQQQSVSQSYESMQNQESWNQSSSEEPQESSINEESPMPTSFLNHPYEELIPPQLTEELEESEGTTFEQFTNLLQPLIIEEKVKEVKVKPELVVEINYEEIQKSPTYSSGYALRFPRLVRLREDRTPDDCTQIDYIEEFYT